MVPTGRRVAPVTEGRTSLADSDGTPPSLALGFPMAVEWQSCPERIHSLAVCLEHWY